MHLKSPNNQKQQKREKGKLNVATNTGANTAKRKATQQSGAIGNQQPQKATKVQKVKAKAKAKATEKAKEKGEATEIFLPITTKKEPIMSSNGLKTIGTTFWIKEAAHQNGKRTTTFLSSILMIANEPMSSLMIAKKKKH